MSKKWKYFPNIVKRHMCNCLMIGGASGGECIG